MLKIKNQQFEIFLNSFPKIELPITLTEDLSVTFSAENKPLRDKDIAAFIHSIDNHIDEYTEYIPCFRIPDTPHFHAVVFWKAMLMENKYVLAVYTIDGQPLDAKVLSITKHSSLGIARSVATIDEDWNILIAKGVEEVNDAYDPNSSKILCLEINPEGKIVPVE